MSDELGVMVLLAVCNSALSLNTVNVSANKKNNCLTTYFFSF
jgi:hypothetical protein